MARFRAAYHQAGKRIRRISKRTLALLEAYRWPGNIRELQNVIERSFIMCESEVFSIDEGWLTASRLGWSRLDSRSGSCSFQHWSLVLGSRASRTAHSRRSSKLRNDPRFVRLCARLGLVEFWVATGKWPDCVDDVLYDFKAECEKVRAVPIDEFRF